LPAGAVSGQTLPVIELEPVIECWYHSDFPVLTALVDPSDEIVRSRLYFRCSLFPDYYFVDLESESGVYTGVAPRRKKAVPRSTTTSRP